MTTSTTASMGVLERRVPRRRTVTRRVRVPAAAVRRTLAVAARHSAPGATPAWLAGASLRAPRTPTARPGTSASRAAAARCLLALGPAPATPSAASISASTATACVRARRRPTVAERRSAPTASAPILRQLMAAWRVDRPARAAALRELAAARLERAAERLEPAAAARELAAATRPAARLEPVAAPALAAALPRPAPTTLTAASAPGA